MWSLKERPFGSCPPSLRISGRIVLALRVQKVADSEDADKKIAQNRLRSSYFGRMMLMVFAIIVGVIVPWFHYISALIPFLIPQPVMMLRRAIVTAREKRGADNSDKGESE